MLQLRFVSFIVFIYILNFQAGLIECRPHTQKIVVHGHEWTVPDEPGWEDGKLFSLLIGQETNDFISLLVLQEAEYVRQNYLRNCISAHQCRLAIEKLRQVFLKHPVSAKYYDTPDGYDLDNLTQSIFRWG